MIAGVMIKPLVPHADERGFFVELIRHTDDFFAEGFGQLSHSCMQVGVVKAWHIHVHQVDWWCMISGTMHVALYDLRSTSPTHRQLQEMRLGENGDNVVLKIPPGVAHGLKVISGPAHLVYATSSIYDRREEGRILYNDPTIDFDWKALGGIPISNTNIT